jgi:hypothetical protein
MRAIARNFHNTTISFGCGGEGSGILAEAVVDWRRRWWISGDGFAEAWLFGGGGCFNGGDGLVLLAVLLEVVLSLLFLLLAVTLAVLLAKTPPSISP